MTATTARLPAARRAPRDGTTALAYYREWHGMSPEERHEIVSLCLAHAAYDCTSCCIGEQVIAESLGLTPPPIR